MSLNILIPTQSKSIKIPLYATSVKAGFPSPADDFIERKLDLNDYLIKHPTATFFVRAEGDSMKNIGIHPGDLLVIDRSLEITDGKIVIAAIDGEFTVKRVKKVNGELFLIPENENYRPIKIDTTDEFQIFGVVSHVIKTLI